MNKKITKCSVRMYTMGTGDCFVLFFKNEEDKVLFKMMIDCGVYNISKEKMDDFATQILVDVENKLDVLLITHEHQDHVLGFQRSEKLFTKNLKINELWMPWTEDSDDPLVEDFKKEYGQKKKSLAIAAHLLKDNAKKDLFRDIYLAGNEDEGILAARLGIKDALQELTELNTDLLPDEENVDLHLDTYKGGLKGYEVVKNKIAKERVRYLQTGSVIENIEGLENIRMYVLGPPKMWTDVKKEHGKEGETYKHNKEIELVRAFSSLPFEDEFENQCPFQSRFVIDPSQDLKNQLGNKEVVKAFNNIKNVYEDVHNIYRRIDYDWLISAAKLSLRLTRGINNLSAVLAIEFVDSGKVMLFPGDAEFGSWKTWHKLEWNQKGKDGKTHLTKDLLNRTVFYKVAHHLSHNGTPKELGMDLLTNSELVAMATLDYDEINSRWKNTMPNRALVRDLIAATKGRFLLSNLDGLYFDKARKIKLEEAISERLDDLSKAKRNAFKSNLDIDKDFFIQFTVNGKS